MSKVIVHIDLNAFFVRAEEIRDPSLEGKPVAIGKEGRAGIVSTCSYKAREYGVHSGMPMFQAKQLCSNLIVLPCDFRFYRTLSHIFMAFVRNYTKIVEIASIDECFADFTDVIKGINDVEGFFRGLQIDLYKKTKLKCSIGVAPTKFLAKMGSDYQKPMGLTIIRKRDIKKILYPLSLDKLFGVGKKTLPRLQALGIQTIGQLADKMDAEDKDVKGVLGKFYFTLNDWLHGKGSDVVVTEAWDPKSIGHSTTLSHDTDDFNEIKPIYERLCKDVAKQVRQEKKMGLTVQINIKEANFVNHNKSITLDHPIDSWELIYKYAIILYEKHFTGFNVRLVGVTLQNLVAKKDVIVQMNLFNPEEVQEDEINALIESINKELDKPLLMRASDIRKDEDK